jgi:hypothetical protein
MIENLAQLLEGETPYHFGRMLYKYTDCGPWTNFILLDKPAHVERIAAEIRKHPRTGMLIATVEPVQGSEDEYDALQFLGFDARGDNQNRWKSLDRYEKRIDAFFRKKEPEVFKATEWHLERNTRCIGCVRVELARVVPATHREVYYEDAEAGNADLPGCIGIEVGSIVEGCDNGIDGRSLLFPFTRDELDALVDGVNKDACLVWDWANVTYDKRGRRHPNGKTCAEMGMDWPLL